MNLDKKSPLSISNFETEQLPFKNANLSKQKAKQCFSQKQLNIKFKDSDGDLQTYRQLKINDAGKESKIQNTSNLEIINEKEQNQFKKQKTFIFDKAFDDIDEVIDEEESNSISSKSENQNIIFNMKDREKKKSLRQLIQNEDIKIIQRKSRQLELQNDYNQLSNESFDLSDSISQHSDQNQKYNSFEQPKPQNQKQKSNQFDYFAFNLQKVSKDNIFTQSSENKSTSLGKIQIKKDSN